MKARLFTRDEIRFVKRYGRKLDQIASRMLDPKTDQERHFFQVCEGTADPTSERERLWLRVRVACHELGSLDRARRCDDAEHRAAVLEQENLSVRRDMAALEQEFVHLLEEYRWHVGDPAMRQRRSIQNVEFATWRFDDAGFVGPPMRIEWSTSERLGGGSRRFSRRTYQRSRRERSRRPSTCSRIDRSRNRLVAELLSRLRRHQTKKVGRMWGENPLLTSIDRLNHENFRALAERVSANGASSNVQHRLINLLYISILRETSV